VADEPISEGDDHVLWTVGMIGVVLGCLWLGARSDEALAANGGAIGGPRKVPPPSPQQGDVNRDDSGQ
jgi:hypothetical protein